MRLIDADALRKQLEEHVDTGTDEFDKGYDLGVQTAIELLDDAPTVEVYTFEQVHELVKLNQQFAQEIENLKRPTSHVRWTDKLSFVDNGDILDFEGRVVGHIERGDEE